MEVPEQLHRLYSAQLTGHDGSYIIEVPEHEVDVGQLQEHVIYRVVMFLAPGQRSVGRDNGVRAVSTSPTTPHLKNGKHGRSRSTISASKVMALHASTVGTS